MEQMWKVQMCTCLFVHDYTWLHVNVCMCMSVDKLQYSCLYVHIFICVSGCAAVELTTATRGLQTAQNIKRPIVVIKVAFVPYRHTQIHTHKHAYIQTNIHTLTYTYVCAQEYRHTFNQLRANFSCLLGTILQQRQRGWNWRDNSASLESSIWRYLLGTELGRYIRISTCAQRSVVSGCACLWCIVCVDVCMRVHVRLFFDGCLGIFKCVFVSLMTFSVAQSNLGFNIQ